MSREFDGMLVAGRRRGFTRAQPLRGPSCELESPLFLAVIVTVDGVFVVESIVLTSCTLAQCEVQVADFSDGGVIADGVVSAQLRGVLARRAALREWPIGSGKFAPLESTSFAFPAHRQRASHVEGESPWGLSPRVEKSGDDRPRRVSTPAHGGTAKRRAE